MMKERTSCLNGTYLFLNVVVNIVMGSSTRQTQSLRQYSMRMLVELWKLQSVEFFQVLLTEYFKDLNLGNGQYQSRLIHIDCISLVFFFSLDQSSAAIDVEFNYKHCCDDSSGMNLIYRKSIQSV